MDESEFSQWIIIGHAGGENEGVSSPCFASLLSTLMCSGCSYHSHNTTEKFDHKHREAANESGRLWHRSALISVINSDGLALQCEIRCSVELFLFKAHLPQWISVSLCSFLYACANECMHASNTCTAAVLSRERNCILQPYDQSPPHPICFSDLTVARVTGIPS